MTSKRVHILSAVNAANVSKDGNTYTIKDVIGAVDDIVMNSRLYPADLAPAVRAKPITKLVEAAAVTRPPAPMVSSWPKV